MIRLSRRVLLQMPFFTDQDGRESEGMHVAWDPQLHGDLNLATLPISLGMRQRLRSLRISMVSQLAMTQPSRLLSFMNVGHGALEKLRHLLLALTPKDCGLVTRSDDLNRYNPERNDRPVKGLVDWDKGFDPDNLEQLPLFGCEVVPPITPCALHQSYLPWARLDELDLPARTWPAFRSLEIETIGELLCLESESLLSLPNFGDKSLGVIREVLRHHLMVFNGLEKRPAVDYGSFQRMMESYVHLAIGDEGRDEPVILKRMGLTTGHPCSLADLGREFGMGREGMRQLCLRALTALRSPSKLRLLDRLWHCVEEVGSTGCRGDLVGMAAHLAKRFGWRKPPSPKVLAQIMDWHQSEMTIPELRREIASREKRVKRLLRKSERLVGELEAVEQRLWTIKNRKYRLIVEDPPPR